MLSGPGLKDVLNAARRKPKVKYRISNLRVYEGTIISLVDLQENRMNEQKTRKVIAITAGTKAPTDFMSELMGKVLP